MDETPPDRFDAKRFIRGVLIAGARIERNCTFKSLPLGRYSSLIDESVDFYAARLAPHLKAAAPQLVLSESDHYPEG